MISLPFTGGGSSPNLDILLGDVLLFSGEAAGLLRSFISIEPEQSPPIRDAHGLYHMTIFCRVLVALGFFPLARSFTSRGTSKAEHKIDKPHILGFDLHGVTVVLLAPTVEAFWRK